MRWLPLLVLGWFGQAACSSTEVTFHCQSSDQCTLNGQIGHCENRGLCSFSDAACPSGRRYGHYSGASDADACTEFNRCGDGFLRASVEECDDGNTTDGDGCSAQCLACPGDNAFLLPETGHCYTRHDQPATFAAAASACEADGSYLVTYTSGVEIHTVIDRLLRPTTTSNWIGLYDAAKDD